MTYRNIKRACPLTAITFAAALLSACGARDISDLQGYVAGVLKRPGGSIEPLPEIKPYERYVYRSGEAGGRDPFEAYYRTRRQLGPEMQMTEAQRRYLDEIESHNPEELENFELDSLRMVGTLNNLGDQWGIVLDSEGAVHRVKVGNYLGRNYGKIVTIAEDQIEVREIVNDGQGGWEERKAALALSAETKDTK